MQQGNDKVGQPRKTGKIAPTTSLPTPSNAPVSARHRTPPSFGWTTTSFQPPCAPGRWLATGCARHDSALSILCDSQRARKNGCLPKCKHTARDGKAKRDARKQGQTTSTETRRWLASQQTGGSRAAKAARRRGRRPRCHRVGGMRAKQKRKKKTRLQSASRFFFCCCTDVFFLWKFTRHAESPPGVRVHILSCVYRFVQLGDPSTISKQVHRF